MLKFYNMQCIFARQTIFSTLCIGRSSGEQDHYDLRHNDERWSELSVKCSFIDITNFTCILILYGCRVKIFWNLKKNASLIFPGNWLGWIFCAFSACAFSALTLLVGWQEGHPVCKNWVVVCWHGYLSGARCRLEYGPADATATHCLLLQ